jgi:regulator of replication initiation timing
VMKLQRQIKELQRKNEMLTGEVTFFREECERLTAENIYLLMEIETLKEGVTKSKEREKKKKTYPVNPQPSKKKKKRGRKRGFKGTSRKVLDHVDEVRDLTLDACPHCGTPFKKSYGKRIRYNEDIPMVQPHVIKYIIHQYYCPHCKRSASESLDDIIPHCRLGINVMLLTVFQKYGLHLSYDNIRKNLELLWHENHNCNTL